MPAIVQGRWHGEGFRSFDFGAEPPSLRMTYCTSRRRINLQRLDLPVTYDDRGAGPCDRLRRTKPGNYR